MWLALAIFAPTVLVVTATRGLESGGHVAAAGAFYLFSLSAAVMLLYAPGYAAGRALAVAFAPGRAAMIVIVVTAATLLGAIATSSPQLGLVVIATVGALAACLASRLASTGHSRSSSA
jgi:hypothetical protein